MGIADGFIIDRAQAETLRSVETRCFQPIVVKRERFRQRIFQI